MADFPGITNSVSLFLIPFTFQIDIVAIDKRKMNMVLPVMQYDLNHWQKKLFTFEKCPVPNILDIHYSTYTLELCLILSLCKVSQLN